MRVDVTEDDIRRGVRGNHNRCPVALAVQREGFPHAMVSAVICEGDTWRPGHLHSPTPPEVRVFTSQFDAGVDVKPFSFEFDWLPYKGDDDGSR